jgi:hypothetical protein
MGAAREVSGLLGVTIVGAILTSRQASVLRGGATPVHAFLSGYQFALLIASAIVFAGVPISLYALRGERRTPAVTEPEPEPVPVG